MTRLERNQRTVRMCKRYHLGSAGAASAVAYRRWMVRTTHTLLMRAKRAED